jgi:cytochrome c553
VKKFLSWLLGLVLVAVVILYVASERRLVVPSRAQFAVAPNGDAVRGKHLAGVIGCTSCHNKDMGGKSSFSEDYVYRLVAPDLTRARDRYTDAALVRLFRTGAKSDGKLALGMPIEQLARMTDQEAADVIAFLRSAPLSKDPVEGSSHLYPLGRVGLLMDQYPLPDPKDIESAAVLRDRNEAGPSRHLLSMTCAECHGLDEKGDPDGGTPPLVVAKAYSLDQFRRLLHTGITITGKDSASGLMSGVARWRFVNLTEDEIVGLHAYLSTGVDNRSIAPPPTPGN